MKKFTYRKNVPDDAKFPQLTYSLNTKQAGVKAEADGQMAISALSADYKTEANFREREHSQKNCTCSILYEIYSIYYIASPSQIRNHAPAGKSYFQLA